MCCRPDGTSLRLFQADAVQLDWSVHCALPVLLCRRSTGTCSVYRPINLQCFGTRLGGERCAQTVRHLGRHMHTHYRTHLLPKRIQGLELSQRDSLGGMQHAAALAEAGALLS